MKLELYIAGSSAELDRVRDAAWLVRDFADVTLEWWRGFEQGRTNESLTDEERYDAAAHDLDAIFRSDGMLVLASERASDLRVELGYALGLRSMVLGRPRIVVAGTRYARGIFGALADSEHETDAEAIEALRTWWEATR